MGDQQRAAMQPRRSNFDARWERFQQVLEMPNREFEIVTVAGIVGAAIAAIIIALGRAQANARRPMR